MTSHLPNCARPGCNHPADWHRLDDSTNVSPTDPAAEFRCIGHDSERDFVPRTPCPVTCPDYVRAATCCGYHDANDVPCAPDEQGGYCCDRCPALAAQPAADHHARLAAGTEEG